MTAKKKRREKEKLDLVSVRMSPREVMWIKDIAGKEDRPYTVVARLLLRRGIAEYRLDGDLLKKPAPPFAFGGAPEKPTPVSR